MNLDFVLITHCSPTLAGLKQASLLCLPRLDSGCTYDDIIEKYNHKYNAKGLYFRILYACSKRTLLYVYRPARVWAYVQQRDISSFLQQFGYQTARTSLPCWTVLPNALQKMAVSLMNRAFSSAIP